jgi:hypothetical protein
MAYMISTINRFLFGCDFNIRSKLQFKLSLELDLRFLVQMNYQNPVSVRYILIDYFDSASLLL